MNVKSHLLELLSLSLVLDVKHSVNKGWRRFMNVTMQTFANLRLNRYNKPSRTITTRSEKDWVVRGG